MKKNSATKKSEMSVMGAEPSLKGKVSRMDLCLALNWYNYFHDIKDCRKWVVDYMKQKGYAQKDISAYSSTPDRMTT